MRIQNLTLAAGIALSLASGAAQAATTIYQYTGQTFSTITNSIGMPFANGQNLSVTLELAAPLAANMAFTDVFNDLVSFDINAGLVSIDETTPVIPALQGASFFVLSTDAAGQIEQWDLVYLNQVQSLTSTLFADPVTFLGESITETSALLNGNASASAPGTWTVTTSPTAVPVPASLPLLLGSVAGLGFLTRKRARA